MNKNSTKIILAVVLLAAAAVAFMWNMGMFSSPPQGAPEQPEPAAVDGAVPSSGEKLQERAD